MADFEDYDYGDTRDEYSSEYPDCEPLATNFYLYSYWWITIIAQVLLIFNIVILIVLLVDILNMFSDPVLLSVCNSVGISQQKLSLP